MAVGRLHRHCRLTLQGARCGRAVGDGDRADDTATGSLERLCQGQRARVAPGHRRIRDGSRKGRWVQVVVGHPAPCDLRLRRRRLRRLAAAGGRHYPLAATSAADDKGRGGNTATEQHDSGRDCRNDSVATAAAYAGVHQPGRVGPQRHGETFVGERGSQLLL